MFCAHCGESIPDEAIFCPKCGERCERFQPTRTETNNGAGQQLGTAGTQDSTAKILCIISCIIYFILALITLVAIVSATGDMYDWNSIFRDDDETVFDVLLFCGPALLMCVSVLCAGLVPITHSRGFASMEGLTQKAMSKSLLDVLLYVLIGIMELFFGGLFDSLSLSDSWESLVLYSGGVVFGDLFKQCLIPLIVAVVLQLCAAARLPRDASVTPQNASK